MPARVTFGIRLPNSGPFASPDMIRETARLAESLGFNTVWVHDHIAWPGHRRTHFAAGSVEAVVDGPAPFYESVATVAFVAGMTSRVRVGIAGLVLPWRDPRVLGKQLATLHELAGRRVVPALAIGRFEDEFEAQQVPYHQRGRITDEYLACLAAMLGPEASTTFNGDRITIRGAEYFPKPQGLPLWIAGTSPAALRRVAKFGQGWLPGGTPEEIEAAVQALAPVMETHGRSVDQIERGLEIFTALAATTPAAAEIAEATLRHQWKETQAGLARTIVGDADAAVERIRRYIAAGISHFELKFYAHTPRMMHEMMRRYAEDVVPRAG